MEIKKREDIDFSLKWDLSHIVKDENELKERLDKSIENVSNFSSSYKSHLSDAATVIEATDKYMEIIKEIYLLAEYTGLATTVEMTNTKLTSSHQRVMTVVTKLMADLSFFDSEVSKLENKILDEIIEKRPDLKGYIDEIKRNKTHRLSDETEMTLASLSSSLEGQVTIYNVAKLVDMDFGTFEAEGKTHDLSFNIFEGVMESEANTEIRRAAFKKFSSVLEKYKNTVAAVYNSKIQTDKTMANLRGFDSVFDYLLFKQNVSREMHDRQVDTIMEELAPHMRKYAKLLKKVHGLDKMKYEDLKLNLVQDGGSEISIEKAEEYIKDGLSMLGKEYGDMISRAFKEHWIDFANNHGKSTGAFCASPYGSHSYILISWTGLMEEVMVLSHELGHAGHFFLSHQNQNIFDQEPSLYFIEAPSTANEIIMELYLLGKVKTKEERKWVLSEIIARTYYHNFVTHFIEAYYQREVYKLVDKGESVNADILSDLFKETLKKFWGEDIELTEGAELTWMRQPHYYEGLYSYTYSAGLTIGTQVAQRIVKEGESAAKDWLETLKLGGTKNPLELAQRAGVDISTDKPLKDTISFIGKIIDELETLI